MNVMETWPVVVGRFQVPEPHAGHRALIGGVIEEFGRVLIVVAYSRGFPCTRHPIPADLRVAMMQRAFPLATVVSLCDCRTDAEWSQRLDALIAMHAPAAVLYGSRDSCLPYYTGLWQTRCMPTDPQVEGSEIRRTIAPESTPEFLAGLCYAPRLREPVSYQTVDIVIWNEQGHILLGQKPHEAQWRFPGGFVDPTDTSLEAAVLREASEEVRGVTIGVPAYLLSHRVADWRYRGSADKILTSVFTCQYLYGAPMAGDDLSAVGWVNQRDAGPMLVPEHMPILEQFLLTRGSK